jgi:hypothetical protein
MAIMNGEKIKNVTRFAAAGRRQRLIRCDVDDMQHIAEYIIANRGKKTKIAVARPFEPHVLAVVLHDRAVNTRFASLPLHREPCGSQQCSIGFRRRSDDFFAIVKNIDVVRVLISP